MWLYLERILVILYCGIRVTYTSCLWKELLIKELDWVTWSFCYISCLNAERPLWQILFSGFFYFWTHRIMFWGNVLGHTESFLVCKMAKYYYGSSNTKCSHEASSPCCCVVMKYFAWFPGTVLVHLLVWH